MQYEITHISIAASGTHEEHITHYWGAFGWKEKQAAVEEVWNNTNQFHVASGIRRAECEAIPPTRNMLANLLYPSHKPYLRTRPDNSLQNNLLSLPRLPAPGAGLRGLSGGILSGAMR